MDKEEKQKFLNYLLCFVTENKKRKMNKIIQERTRHVTIVLEDLYQSHNASAVLRTAECFGVQDVHVVQKRNQFKAKEGVAMGASKWLSVFSYEDVSFCCSQLRKKGYRIVATSPHEQSCSLQELPINKPLALIFGTEELGLTSEGMRCADQTVKIPMYGFTESFNVSVSVALCLYKIITQLRGSNVFWRLSDQELLDLHIQWVRTIVRGADVLEKRFFSIRF